MKLLLILKLLLYFLRIKCKAEFLESTSLSMFEESYVLDNVEYILTNKQVSWFEAEMICRYSGDLSSLAVLNSTKIIYFLNEVLGDTNLILNSLWVQIKEGSCVLSNETSRERCTVCPTFKRKRYKDPFFTITKCFFRRPYICQRAFQRNSRDTRVKWINTKTRSYAIIKDRVTWIEALRHCVEEHDAHLADFNDYKDIKFLLSNISDFHDSWISGYFKNERWRYITTSNVISNSFVRIRKESGENANCLMLDKNFIKAGFIPNDCDKMQTYICSKEIPNKLLVYFFIDNICYILHYEKKSWIEAQTICHQKDGWLAEVTDDKFDGITNIFRGTEVHIQNIWVGGIIKSNKKWYWAHTNTLINSVKYEIFNPKYIKSMDYSCLNMENEFNNDFTFYGSLCEEPQFFLCEQANSNVDKCKDKEDDNAENTKYNYKGKRFHSVSKQSNDLKRTESPSPNLTNQSRRRTTLNDSLIYGEPKISTPETKIESNTENEGKLTCPIFEAQNNAELKNVIMKLFNTSIDLYLCWLKYLLNVILFFILRFKEIYRMMQGIIPNFIG